MEYNLKCPTCKHEFIVDEEYQSADCPNCAEAYYYWDHIWDEELGEEFFAGYYWCEYLRK